MPAQPTLAASERPDVAVIGAGIVGLSTAYALLERGRSVRVYEHGVPGNGQSGGVSRIFRHAHEDPRMIAAAQASRQAYTEWGEQLDVEMVSADGAVAIGSPVESQLSALQDAGVDAREIGSTELARRVPMLAGYDGPALLDVRGGSIRTTATIAALTAALGSRMVADEVISVRPVPAGVEVRSGGRTDVYRRVVVCAGRGTAALARTVGLTLPVQQAAHVRLTFAVRGTPPQTLATLQDSSGVFGETGVYAAPAPDHASYAVGLSQTTPARDDASMPAPGGLAELATRAADYVRRALPGLDPDPIDVRHCWVTSLPWGDDAMSVWETDGILFPAGHNLFKQAPGLGRQLAAAVDGEELDAVLRPESRLGAA